MSGVQQGLRIGQPLWLDRRTSFKRGYPNLSGKHEARMAIVGGGMTGALVAHAFASASRPPRIRGGVRWGLVRSTAPRASRAAVRFARA